MEPFFTDSRRRILAFLCVAGALAAACAVEVPPSGGPEDKVGPTVTASVPARDSTGVDPASAITIGFSEDMTRTQVERSVVFQPPITIGKVHWTGRALVIEPLEPLQRDTTYVVRIKPGYRDAHGVSSTSHYEFAFATGAVLDTARIEGLVSFKHEPSGKAVVRCFRLPKGKDFDPTGLRPDREAATGRDGRYRLRYLAADDAHYVVFAFLDVNGNGTFDRSGEPYTVLPDTLVLTPGAPVLSGVDITIIDPNEPGVVKGRVANETGIDTLRVTVELFAPDDTTHVRGYLLCDNDGVFSFDKVKPGDYRLQAFLDIHADSTRGTWECPDTTKAPCIEPYVWFPDTLTVRPAGTTTVPDMVLRRKAGS